MRTPASSRCRSLCNHHRARRRYPRRRALYGAPLVQRRAGRADREAETRPRLSSARCRWMRTPSAGPPLRSPRPGRCPSPAAHRPREEDRRQRRGLNAEQADKVIAASSPARGGRRQPGRSEHPDHAADRHPLMAGAPKDDAESPRQPRSSDAEINRYRRIASGRRPSRGRRRQDGPARHGPRLRDEVRRRRGRAPHLRAAGV